MGLVRLYNQDTIDTLPWEEMSGGYRIKNYLTALVKEGVQPYIKNIKTEMFVLTIDDLALPVTANDTEYFNSHVCSPYTHYVTAVQGELKLFDNWLLRKIIAGVLKTISPFLKWGRINRIVSVNNWLIATNLYLNMTQAQIAEITQYLKKRFPKHAIEFRSLNFLTNSPLIASLQQLRYRLVLSRQVYLIDGSQDHFFHSNNFRKDLVLCRKKPYILSPCPSEQDPSRILALYQEVYLDKHASHNPQFSHCFVKLVLNSDCWTVRLLKDNDHIVGVFASLQLGNTMIWPFFGYDTTLPQEQGLYRIISTQVSLEAKKRGLILNHSSGAASFKRLRRAIPELEYRALYYSHLSFRQKMPWILLRLFLNKIGAKLLKHYQV